MKHLASNLYYLRTRNGYTQEELANHLFLTHQTISNHETGKTEPDFSIIQKYADFYHISAEDLLLNDLSKKEKNSRIIFDSVIFDKRDKVFIIISGTKGTYSYKNIKKCEILNEKARYKGKEEPFTHQVVTGVDWLVQANILEQPFYVGLRLTMKDGTHLAIYTSKQPTRTQTDFHIRDVKEAEKIKKLIDKIIMKYKNDESYKMDNVNSKNILFDKDRQTFQILSGSKGIYPMKDVYKCQIVFEDAKYYGKTKPFSHRLLISSFESFFVTLRDTYVGLEIELKNKEKLYVYVSNIKQKHYSDAFKADVKVSETLKKYFKTIITGNKTMKDE